jgi:hypothetical protein
VLLEVLTDVLLVVGLVAGIYSMMTGKPKRRRVIAQRLMILAISGVLLSEAYTRTGWWRWGNLGIGLFCILSVGFEVLRERRRGQAKTQNS